MVHAPPVPLSDAATEVTAPCVVIVLATWNGAANLQAQLDSYRTQTLRPSLLIVGDDGSTDQTMAILTAFAASAPGFDVRIQHGPRRGAARNFLSLLQDVPPEADYLAISDQDDVWLPDRLAQGVRRLAALPTGQVGLLGGRTYVCDATLTTRRLSPRPSKKLGFRHALVQNFAGGNTMLLNRPGIALVQAAAVEVRRIVVHDWWFYQIVSGCGGEVIFEETPLVLYRQHAENQIGANSSLRSKLRRLVMLIRGDFRRWNAINLRALRASAHRLTPENRALVEAFHRMQRAGVIERLTILRQLGAYRQGLEGTLSLWLAAILGRV